MISWRGLKPSQAPIFVPNTIASGTRHTIHHTQASGARHRVMSICQHRQTFLAHQGSAQGTRSPVDAAAPRETLQDFLGVMRRSVESRPRRHRNQVASHPTLPSHLREKGENHRSFAPYRQSETAGSAIDPLCTEAVALADAGV